MLLSVTYVRRHADLFYREAGSVDAPVVLLLHDFPHADLHLFDTGHCALEEHVAEIAALIGTFVEKSNRR